MNVKFSAARPEPVKSAVACLQLFLTQWSWWGWLHGVVGLLPPPLSGALPVASTRQRRVSRAIFVYVVKQSCVPTSARPLSFAITPNTTRFYRLVYPRRWWTERKTIKIPDKWLEEIVSRRHRSSCTRARPTETWPHDRRTMAKTGYRDYESDKGKRFSARCIYLLFALSLSCDFISLRSCLTCTSFFHSKTHWIFAKLPNVGQGKRSTCQVRRTTN